MRGSLENENTKIRNSLTNVHERSRCVCLSMTVLACASGIVRPREVAKTAHGSVVMATWPRSINTLMRRQHTIATSR